MSRKDAIGRKLDKVTARIAKSDLVPGYRLVEQALAQSEKQDDTSQAKSKISERLGLLVALTCLVLGTAFFISRLLDYEDWPPAIYAAPHVYNLTKERVKWDVHYGESKGCRTDECYRLESTPSSFFRRQEVLPMQEFPLKQWQKAEPIFYRATIKIPENIKTLGLSQPLSLHTIIMFSKSWDMFLNNQLVFQGTQETMLAPIPNQYIRDDGTVNIAIRAYPGDLPYQGISNRGDMVIGPRADLANLANFARDNGTIHHLIYLLPKLSFGVVFAMLFMFVRRNKEIMWFLLFGLTSSLELFFRSDYSSGLGLSGQTTELLALMSRNYSFMLMARFVYAFFRLEFRRGNIFMASAFAAITIFNLFCLGLLSYKTATTSLDVIAIVLKPCVYVFSVVVAFTMAGILSKSEKSLIRSRIALFFSALFLVGCGLAFIDLARLIVDTFPLLKISIALPMTALTWSFDLVLFVFMASVTGIEMAMQHSHQRFLQNQLQNLDDRLELAQSVQTTLLPSQMNGTRGNVTWNCRYISAERLAGDWIFLSDGRHQNTTFFLGDVTGKGPAAALAVAAIVSLLRKKDFEPSSLDATIKELNIHLFNLFRGNVGSAVCIAQMDNSGNAALAVHGMAGWVHVSKTGARIVPARGQCLGSTDQIDTELVHVQLDIGDYLFAFSDGCIDGTRPISRMVRTLTKDNQRTKLTADELFNLVVELGKDVVHPDDKAMIFIRRAA